LQSLNPDYAAATFTNLRWIPNACLRHQLFPSRAFFIVLPVGNDRHRKLNHLFNIERIILYLLGDRLLDSITPIPFDTRRIFDKFSDIPDNNMKTAMQPIKEEC
jgi:hypothetical protein